ncbi:MAG: hypothetical protein EXQ70_04715 [Solirubrobacterales bacterium]|nr:hypothetical protein [Solirubrobacterales bacterium]
MAESRPKRVALAATMTGLVACAAFALPMAQAKQKHVTKTKTLSSGDLALTPPDPQPGVDAGDFDPNLVRSFLGVGGIPDQATIKDVNVSVRITADDASDVEAYLATPRGVLDLTTDNGGFGNDFGTGAADCSGTPTVFDDQAAISVTLGAAPFVDSFDPEQALSALNGLKAKKAKSRWTLLVGDDDPVGAVTLNCWKLRIRYRT